MRYFQVSGGELRNMGGTDSEGQAIMLWLAALVVTHVVVESARVALLETVVPR